MSETTTKPADYKWPIKNNNNAKIFNEYEVGEVNNQESQTVPDQSLTVKQIIQRSERGQPLYGTTPEYLGEEIEVPNFATLDISERAAMLEQTNQRIQELRDNVKQQRDAAFKKQLEEKFNEESERRKKEQQIQNNSLAE